MKSLFLKKLSALLISDKETDYFDLYNLQTLKDWPMFSSVYYNYQDENSKTIDADLNLEEKNNLETIEPLGLEYCEIISFNEKEFIIDTGGEFQGINRIVIYLNNQCELSIKSCTPIPEMESISVQEITRPSIEEYEKRLDYFQYILENQD